MAVCLMGPTATGKSDLAIDLARRFPFEIVSVDSAQVYRGMDIGTAKPDRAIRSELPHHLIDIRDPSEPYSAADFRRDALAAMADITDRGKIPLLVGGTMLYFKALKEGLASLPSADNRVRERISRLAREHGWEAVHARLAEVDPETAGRIHPNDPQRLQRALEVYEITGQPMSRLYDNQHQPPPYRLCEIGILPDDRGELHRRIEKRFDQMVTDGLIDEVRGLYARGDLTAELPAIKAVGYRQVWQFLDGEIDAGTMRAKAVTATRRLAKHQITWLRTWKDLKKIDRPHAGEALKILQSSSILNDF